MWQEFTFKKQLEQSTIMTQGDLAEAVGYAGQTIG